MEITYSLETYERVKYSDLGVNRAFIFKSVAHLDKPDVWLKVCNPKDGFEVIDMKSGKLYTISDSNEEVIPVELELKVSR